MESPARFSAGLSQRPASGGDLPEAVPEALPVEDGGQLGERRRGSAEAFRRGLASYQRRRAGEGQRAREGQCGG